MPQKVRAKFRCESVTKRQGDSEDKFVFSSEFFPVTGGSEENEEFYKWTPCGKLEIGTTKKDHFEPGKEYYIDISPAD